MSESDKKALTEKQKRGEAPIKEPPKNPVCIEDQLDSLVSGKTPPPNETVAYLVGRFREAQASLTGVAQALQEADRKAQQLRGEAQALKGQLAGYAQDLQHWITKSDATS